MLEILILVLITINTGGNPCNLGTSVNWTDYAMTSTSVRYATLRDANSQFDLYSDGVLFVYRDDMQEGIDGHPHGECAIKIEVN